MTRRDWLRGSSLGMAALGARPAAGSAAVRPPAYRIIYNWDGAPHGYSEYPQPLEQFLEKTYAPMRNTQVGAHFWCIGGHQANWPSKTLEQAERTYDSAMAMRGNENLRAMFERGENPYQVLVKRGHELGLAVYASVRMNDNHFNGLQLEDLGRADVAGLTRLRRQHPEWCLGPRQAPRWFAASWNFAIPEVREHRLEYIREVCGLANWDGIELDWQRHAFHLPADDAYRLRYALTDLQRAVRRMTSQLARERGRPFHLAVRVATTMEACRRIGYDLETWAKEDLCDIVTAAGGALTDPGIEVEAFADLLRNAGIRFYTGFDSGFWGGHRSLMPQKEWERAWVRAMAKGYWERGANGMYVFNWHANERSRRALLTTIGASETLRGTDKVYAAVHRHIGGWPFDAPKDGSWAGADLNDRIYGETPVALYRTLTGDGPVFHVPVHDDVAAESGASTLQGAELHVELERFSPADRVALSLDGKALSQPAVRNVAGETRDEPSAVDENSWLVWPLSPEQAGRGPHEVRAQLVKRDPRILPPLVVRSVEIHLKYR